MRIVSGLQSSGRLHLGNWFGAVRQLVRLQDAGEAFDFIADLHALTTVRDGERARALTFETAAGLLALGIDPTRTALFRQSDVPEVLELYWILGTVVPLSHLERAHAYKDKLARGLAAGLGLFAYPVLMAADILLYGADLVPVGKDQIQHVEFARDWATRFNVAHVPGYDPRDPLGGAGHPPGILKPPDFRVDPDAAVLPGIDGQKMSRSYGNAIELFADERDVRRRIQAIKTDSTPVEAGKPVEGSALYQLLRALAPASEFAAIDRSWRQGGTGYGAYKEQLTGFFFATFGEARRRCARIAGEPAEVERIAPPGPPRGEPDPKNAIEAPELRSLRLAAEQGELLPEGQILEREVSATSERRAQGAQQSEGEGHGSRWLARRWPTVQSQHRVLANDRSPPTWGRATMRPCSGGSTARGSDASFSSAR